MTQDTVQKHTPAPWTVGANTNGELSAHSIVANLGTADKPFIGQVATVLGSYASMDIMEGRANAALIAAAPDLLEALTNLLGAHTTLLQHTGNSTVGGSSVNNARIALAKAKGGA